MAQYNVILFDLDGTLTDSKPGIVKSVQFALEKIGIKEENLEHLTRFVGPPLHESFQKFYGLTLRDAERSVQFYREFFEAGGIFDNAVYDGIPEMLENLLENDKTLILATSKPTVYARQILEYFTLDKVFTEIWGSNLDGTRTNKADVIQCALASLQHSHRQAVMIGDREHDIFGAKKNALDSIAVTYGYGSSEELTEAQPTYFAASPEEIQEIIV